MIHKLIRKTYKCHMVIIIVVGVHDEAFVQILRFVGVNYTIKNLCMQHMNSHSLTQTLGNHHLMWKSQFDTMDIHNDFWIHSLQRETREQPSYDTNNFGNKFLVPSWERSIRDPLGQRIHCVQPKYQPNGFFVMSALFFPMYTLEFSSSVMWYEVFTTHMEARKQIFENSIW